MNQAIRKLSGLLVLPMLLAALLLMPVRAYAEDTDPASEYNNDYACDVTLPVNMKLNGNHSEAFEVIFEADADKNKGAAVPMPAATTLSLKKGESAGFTMHYTKPGDYFYKVSQTAGETPYMTYDDTVYYVQIQITNTDDFLDLKSQVVVTTAEDTETKQSEVSFLNTYAPPAPEPAATATPTPTPIPATPTPTPVAGLLPQTGDTMPLVTVLVVMLVAAAALVVLLVARKRKNSGK